MIMTRYPTQSYYHENEPDPSLVLCTDLLGKELHRQIGRGRVVMSGSLVGVIASTLARNARHVCLIPILGAIPPYCHYPHDTGCRVPDPLQVVRYMVVEPTLCTAIGCMYVIVSIKRHNSRRMSVVVYTDLSGKDLHRQVGAGGAVTSRSLGGVMVSTLACNAKDVGSNPTLSALFPNFITHRRLDTEHRQR